MARMRLHAPEAQSVTFVELFFDLVFVFAVTQVTVLTAHHLDASGVARSGLIFWLIWWAWTQFTWTLNPADTQHTLVRALTLVATAAAFVMAASVPQAFDEGGGLWFALPYIAIRAIGMGLQVRIDHERDGDGSISMRWVYLSVLGLIAVLAGGVVDDELRPWLWLGALALDLVASATASRYDAVWDIDAGHFSERHGLFVIIALGESLIVAASAVAEDERTADLVLAAGASLVVACLLWWTYFGWLKEAMEEAFDSGRAGEAGTVARDAYSLTHFPLVCGIVGFAVAVEEIVLHPERAAEGPVVASLVVGVALFVGATALAYWRTTRHLLARRLVIMAVALAVAALLRDADPVWPLAAVASGLLAVIVVEERHDRHRAAHAAPAG